MISDEYREAVLRREMAVVWSEQQLLEMRQLMTQDPGAMPRPAEKQKGREHGAILRGFCRLRGRLLRPRNNRD